MFGQSVEDKKSAREKLDVLGNIQVNIAKRTFMRRKRTFL